MQEENPLILIYFSGRGKLQPVRNLISYLDLKYYEVHLDNEQTKNKIPENIKAALKGVKIDKNALPMMVHKGHTVSDTFPIISYISRNYESSLLGKSIRQRARVNQLIQCIVLKEQTVMLDIFAFVQGCMTKTKEQILRAKMILFEKIMNESSFVKQICLYLQKQDKQEAYVLEDITIIDFYFMEMCVKMVGFFKDLEQKKFSAIEIFFKGIFKCEQNSKQSENSKYITTMIKYLDFMREQPFYKKHQKYLEQYSLVCPKFADYIEGFRKAWAGDPIYIK